MVLVAFAVVALLLGMTGAATVVGEALPGKLKNNRSGLRCLILGIVVFAVVALLPFGGLLLALAFAFSLGAVVLSRMGAVTPVR